MLTDKMLKNVEANSLAAFDELLALTKARDLPEVLSRPG
jgi:hypothetical protein